MVWVTGLITALLVLAADFASTLPVQGAGWHIGVGLIFLLLAPAFAVFQSFVTVRRWRGRALPGQRAEILHRSLMIGNLLVWLFGCVALLVIARWPQVIRQNWHLDRVPLLDELVLALPMIGSVLLSWLVIYDAEQSIQSTGAVTRSARLSLTWQRFRTIGGLVLVPIAVLFLARDILGLLYPDGAGNAVTFFCYLTFLALLLALYPLLVSFSWKTRDLEDRELLGNLRKAAVEAGLPGERISVWQTDLTLANAVVVGVAPRWRRVFFSDLLLQQFDRQEVVAIYRHELGHLVRGHLPMRLALVLVPLLAMAALSIPRSGDEGVFSDSVFSAIYWAVAPLVFFVYLATVVTRFIRKSEIEADLFAISKPDGTPCPRRAESYCRALLKMAAHSPELYQRSTWVHPSIQIRIEVIRQVLRRPRAVEKFGQRFRFEQHLAAAVLLFLILGISWGGLLARGF